MKISSLFLFRGDFSIEHRIKALLQDSVRRGWRVLLMVTFFKWSDFEVKRSDYGCRHLLEKEEGVFYELLFLFSGSFLVHSDPRMIFNSLLVFLRHRQNLVFQLGNLQSLESCYEFFEQRLLLQVHVFYKPHCLRDRQWLETRFRETFGKRALDLPSEQNHRFLDSFFFFWIL